MTKANDVPLIADPGPPKTCEGCAWTSKKWTYLGRRPYCRLYVRIRNERCIDFKPKTVTPGRQS